MIIFRQSLVAVVADGGIVKYLRRVGWGAIEPREKRVQLKTPVKYVIISHTALLGRCTTTDDCCRDARKVQKFNMEKSHFADIAYNGLVGDNGVLLDGRGFDVQAATAYGWNQVSLGFAFMGLFVRDVPGEEALAALKNFLGYLVDQGNLAPDYIIYALCQVRPFPESPGTRLYREIQTWPHWQNRSGSYCNNA
ncbi:Peptidoglycan-recognition protein LE [Lamellibrachia satsuma]|nr:Peptidoglycan-recognition protein LE [Lamellibrachia satsuma]